MSLTKLIAARQWLNDRQKLKAALLWLGPRYLCAVPVPRLKAKSEWLLRLEVRLEAEAELESIRPFAQYGFGNPVPDRAALDRLWAELDAMPSGEQWSDRLAQLRASDRELYLIEGGKP